MGVMNCSRNGCDTAMCHRHNREYGYICHECFEELCESALDVDDFMSTKKDPNKELKRESKREYLNKLFPQN